jgi:hypothetical protein
MKLWDKLRSCYKMSGTARIDLKVTGWYGVRTPLEKPLYELALKHATNAESCRMSGNHKDELEQSILAIVLAAAFMEAFINQQGIQLFREEFQKYDEGYIDVYGNTLSEKRGYPKLEDKWSEITEKISGKRFNKGKEPFSGFKKLVELRNKILHYKGMPSTPMPSPWPDVQGHVTPEKADFNASTARYAITSMQGMLHEFSTLTSKEMPEWIK